MCIQEKEQKGKGGNILMCVLYSVHIYLNPTRRMKENGKF
jgi:hypothetical protein